MPADPALWTHGQGYGAAIAKSRMQQEDPEIRVERSNPKMEDAGKARMKANARAHRGGRVSR